jgi:Fic family protein
MSSPEHPEFDFCEPNYPAAPGYMKQSETSRQAAKEITLAAGTLRRLIYTFIKEQNGATCDEAEVALNLRHQTASARITELRLAGKLRPIGTRATRSGRQADVLVAITPENGGAA